jgi:hypothetical protein
VSEFVEECRREWRRLGVPDPIAAEMAAELAADLEEAASEGASVEDVLGSAALDSRSFAGSWATERGVVRPGSIERRPHAMLAAAVGIAVAAALMIGGSLTILTSDADPPDAGAWVAAPPQEGLIALPGVAPAVVSGPSPVTVTPDRVLMREPGLEQSSDNRLLGWILLTLGLVGLGAASTIWSLWGRSLPQNASP